MEPISTPNAPQAIGPYSQAIKANGFIFCSGQIPLRPDGTLNEGDIKEQTHQVLTNVKNLLESAGSSLDKIVKTTIFLDDMNDYQTVNEIYSEYFTANKPARSTIEVARIPKDVKVEIECIALA